MVLHGFEHQTRSRESILITFFFLFLVPLMYLTWVFSGRVQAKLQLADRLTMLWFAVSGPIHLFVEGYYSINREFYKDTTGHFLADIWKEYSKCDSRYARRDDFIVTMETFTAFVEGPACFFIVYLIAKDHPKKWVWMILTCFGQLYGDILYFATEWHNGYSNGKDDIVYFWFYFVIVNSMWVIFPCIIIWRSWNAVNNLLLPAEKKSMVAKANGHSKKH